MPKKAETADRRDTIVRAALDLTQDKGWDAISLSDIAQAAKVTMPELRMSFDDKADILNHFGRMIDRKAMEAIGTPHPEDTTRDRLFEVMMARFDVLNEDKGAVQNILGSFRHDPKQALLSAPYLCKSMNWMLEAAGIDTAGMRGALKVAGLTAIYMRVLKTWLDDDTPDMAQTMAVLDKSLAGAEQWANTLGLSRHDAS